jgi:hypothetical protein
MTFRLPFGRRGRRRPRRLDDPSQVFKTFVHVLGRMQAHARGAAAETAAPEKS